MLNHSIAFGGQPGGFGPVGVPVVADDQQLDFERLAAGTRIVSLGCALLDLGAQLGGLGHGCLRAALAGRELLAQLRLARPLGVELGT